jgi:hypothetical protein
VKGRLRRMEPEIQQVGPSEYKEFAVPKSLATHFLCLWTQTITGCEPYTHRVLPDACVDIIFVNDNPPIVAGPSTNAFMIQSQPGTRVVGARLRPGRVRDFLGVPAAELLNETASLSDLGKLTARRLERVVDARTLQARKAQLSDSLARATAALAVPDDSIMASIRWLGHHPEGTIDQLSEWSGMGQRQLHRKFLAAAGYGPKMVQSVLRFQRLLRLASGPGRSLAE